MGMDVFAPLMMQPQLSPPSRLDARGIFGLTTMGHLKPGVTNRGATAEAAVFASQLESEHPVPNYDRRFEVVPIWQSPFGAQTYWLPAIGVLGGMGLLILLVVCANVANLVLVRGVSRRGELGVRLALGASRSRLLRLLFVENVVLALPGALAGVALASVRAAVRGDRRGIERTVARLPRYVGGRLRADVCDCLVVRMRDRLRVRAGTPRVAGRARPGAERCVAADGLRRTVALDAGRVPGGGLAVTAGGGGAGAAQLPGGATRGCRVRRGERHLPLLRPANRGL